MRPKATSPNLTRPEALDKTLTLPQAQNVQRPQQQVHPPDCDCVGDDVEIRPPPKDPPPPPKPPPARETYTVCTGLLLFVLTKLVLTGLALTGEVVVVFLRGGNPFGLLLFVNILL